jgi:hypothetical protein
MDGVCLRIAITGSPPRRYRDSLTDDLKGPPTAGVEPE